MPLCRRLKADKVSSTTGFTELYMTYYRMFADIEEAQKQAYEDEHGQGSWEDYDPTEF